MLRVAALATAVLASPHDHLRADSLRPAPRAESFAEVVGRDLDALKGAGRRAPAGDPDPDPATGIWRAHPGVLDDACMARALVGFFTRENASVTDLGAGDGHYSRHLSDAGLRFQCFDGFPGEADLSRGLCSTKDLSKPLAGVQPTSWALSLEVGEHIPKAHEQTFIQNVVGSMTDGVVLSWAVPGQQGQGHVNCQPNSYVEEQMRQRGLTLDRPATQWFREQLGDERACGSYFKHTTMVFRRSGEAAGRQS